DGGVQLVVGHDLDVPLDELRRKAHVLPAPADRQRELVLLDQDDGALEPLVEEDLVDVGRLQGVADEHLQRVVPAHDVDALAAAELLDDVLDAAAADADAGTDAIDAAVNAADGDLGAVAGLARDPLDLDGAVLDLGDLALEEALDE